jgi:maltose 6'-phosphate phosphatase
MFKILTLNLHGYQEIDSGKSKSLKHFFKEYKKIQEKIAQFMLDKDIDIAVFQEAVQHKDMNVIEEKYGVEIREKNYIKVLQEILKKEGKLYEYAWDWAHYGWNDWEEGIGILSRYPIIDFKSKYVSKIHDVNSFNSRKLLKTSINFNGKIINVYAVHFNWPEKGFKEEYSELVSWISGETNNSFIIAGDFNVDAGSKEYQDFLKLKVDNQKIKDVFYEVNPDKLIEPTFRGDQFNKGARIDYILTSENFKVLESKIVFKDEDEYGRVSDHMGVYAKLEI